MTPYSPGKPIDEVRRELGLAEVVKLASNENPLGPSPMAVEAVKRAAEEMHLYPDASGYQLKKAISAKFCVPPEQVMLGNGSDELIHILGQVFLGSPSDEIIVGDPSFVRYDAAAHLAACKLVKVPLDREYVHDLGAMGAAVTANTRLVFIANPNNPTGTMVRREDLRAFLRGLPDHVVTVLDEAYFEYAAEDPDYPSSIEFVQEGLNVVGLRTFSKAYGLAGIRIGYGFAPAAIIDATDRAREPFNTNSLAQAAAVAALGDDDHLRRTLAANRAGKEAVMDAFRQVGAAPVPTSANFVWADLGRPAQPVFESILRRGVIVRAGLPVGSPNAIRVTIGTAAETSRFVEALKAAMLEEATR